MLNVVPYHHELFQKVLNKRVDVGEELRIDAEPESESIYIGIALDGAPTSEPVWNVVRFYLSASGTPNRVRFRSYVRWDQRTSGW